MKKRLEKKLFRKFDFFHPEKSMKKGLMCFGFDCGNGWYKIILNLSKKIDKILKEELGLAEFEVMQVKEKFGRLCYYTNYSCEAINEEIRKAEMKSFVTCEICGKKGEGFRRNYWYKTLCKRCAKKEKYHK